MGWNRRSRRTRSRETRLAVASATAPLANSTRALARSRWELSSDRPGRADLGGFGAAGQMQHQVEVVDHEIEHHGHVGAAGLERRQPLALDVPRAVEVGLGGAKRAIVALDVAHLELEPARPRPRR